MIALDLDGTLLDYAPEGPQPRVNGSVILSLLRVGAARTGVAICTNQGGLPWHVMGARRKDERPYPSPEQFCLRLRAAVTALSGVGIKVVAVRVSVFHPRADEAAIQRAARAVRTDLGRLMYVETKVYTTARARKPQPLMLHSVVATEYWGDSDEDGGAAQAAGVPFVRVERFLG